MRGEREAFLWRTEPIPDVIYAGNINKEDSPYSLQIDAALLGEMFREELGIAGEQIARTKLVVVAGGGRDYHGPLEFVVRDSLGRFFGQPGGTSFFADGQGRRRIIIYPDNVLDRVEAARNRIIRFSDESKKRGLSFWDKVKERMVRPDRGDVFVSERLVDYSKGADSDEVRGIVDKLFPYVAERLILTQIINQARVLSYYEKWSGAARTARVLLPAVDAVLIDWMVLGRNVQSRLLNEGVEGDVFAISIYLLSALSIYTTLEYGIDQTLGMPRSGREIKTRHKWRDIVSFKLNRPLGPTLDTELF